MSAENKKATVGRSLLMVALACLLVAGWIGKGGYDEYLYNQTTEALEQARDQAVTGIQQAINAQISKLDQSLEIPSVQSALAGGMTPTIVSALKQNLNAQDVQIFDARLEQAYADMEGFGLGRLGLLEMALRGTNTTAVAQVVRDDGKPVLGLAVPVVLEGRRSVIYVRQSLSLITSVLNTVSLPENAFIGLRQGAGTFDLARAGNSALGSTAETLARPIYSHLRIVAELPESYGAPFGLSAISALATGGGLGLLGLILLGVGSSMAMGNRPKRPREEPKPKARPKKPEPEPEEDSDDDASSKKGFRLSLNKLLRKKSKPENEEEDIVAAAPPPPPTVAPPPPAPPPVRPRPVPAAPPPPTAVNSDTVPAAIFRAYDIRGIVGKELTPDVVKKIGQAIGNVMQERMQEGIVVGRDGRLSGEELSDALIAGLRLAGCEVTDIGMAPTPVVYFAREQLAVSSCVAVTGSHNPADYNGFKIVIGGETLYGEAITDLYTRCSSPGMLYKGHGQGALKQASVIDDYIQRIAGDVQMERPLKVVIDAGNGVAGLVAPQLLETIGAEVIPLHCEVDGTFPNHHPDPGDPANLEDLKQIVAHMQADMGIAFDGDGDRMGVVTREGAIIFPDRLLMLFASDVLMRNPGALVIFDVKCSNKLHGHILLNGGSPMMWKTGHSFIKAKMLETGAELAGEMSGHFFFSERWYGFDDGIYAAARLLEILTQDDRPPSEVLDELPNSPATPEIKVPVREGQQHQLVERFTNSVQGGSGTGFSDARISTIDGLRADFSDGWGLVRASNTTPVLVLRFEGDNPAALARIKRLFSEKLAQMGIDAQF